MAKVTLQDIARVCEVDISTVSRALRADPRVAEPSRQRIVASARRLGYRPNLLARNLAGGSTKTIWLIIPSLDVSIDSNLVRFANHHANAQDYTLFAALHDCDGFRSADNRSLIHYTQMIERAGQGLADGALILPRRSTSDASLLGDLVRQNFPMVFIDNYVEELPVPVVTTDNRQATAELARRCVAAGAREAVLIFEEPNPVAQARLAGAQEALRELGVPFLLSQQLPADWTPQHLGSAVAILSSSQLFAHRFTVRHADHWSDKHLVFGVFDEWIGEPSPAEKVIIVLQDANTIASRAFDLLLGLIRQQPVDAPRISLVPVLEYRTIMRAF